ncbi:hypothetical protein [Lactiplantibacillus plantarum]
MAESNATQVILTDDGIKIIKAQNTANNAASGVTNLNDPNLMSVIEKQYNITQFAGLTSQYNVLVQNAKDDGIDTTAVTTAYNNLNQFMASVLADPDHASDIDRVTYKKYQDAYNEELAKLQNALQNNTNDKFTSAASATRQAASTASQAVLAASQSFKQAQEIGKQADSAIAVQSTATAKAQKAADDAFSKAQAVGNQASKEILVQSTATAKAQSKADDAFSKAATAIDNGKVTSQAVTDLKDGSKLTIAELENGLATKVANSEYASYKTQTASQIASKVATKEFSTYKTQTADLISEKVATKDFSAYRDTTAKAIESKVESKDFNTYKEQTDKAIISKVSSTDLDVYNRNLLLDSQTQMLKTSWYNKNGSWTSEQGTYLGSNIYRTSSAWDNARYSYKDLLDRGVINTTDDFTYSVYFRVVGEDPAGMSYANICFISDATTKGGNIPVQLTSLKEGQWTRLVVTFKFKDVEHDHADDWQYPLRVEMNAVPKVSGAHYEFSAPKLERGTTATLYSIAPEDQATQSQITQLSGEIEQKVNSGDFSTYKTETAKLIGSKVKNGDFSSYKEETARIIKSKVDNGDFSSYKEETAREISSTIKSKDFESYKKQLDGILEDKVSSSQYTSEKKQTDEMISNTVSDAIKGLKISNRNLALGTTTPFKMNGNGSENNSGYMYALSKTIASGTTVTISFDITTQNPTGDYSSQFAGGNWQGSDVYPMKSGTQHHSYTLVTSSDYTDGVRLRLDNSTATVTVSNFIISESSKEVGWTPAPEDQATQSQITQLKDNIDLRVTKKGLIDEINLQAGNTLISSSGQLTLSGKNIYFDSSNPVMIPSANIDALLVGKQLKAADISANTFTTNNGTFTVEKDGAITAKNMTLTGGTLTTPTINSSTINGGTLNMQTDGLINSPYNGIVQTADQFYHPWNLNTGQLTIGQGYITSVSSGTRSINGVPKQFDSVQGTLSASYLKFTNNYGNRIYIDADMITSTSSTNSGTMVAINASGNIGINTGTSAAPALTIGSGYIDASSSSSYGKFGAITLGYNAHTINSDSSIFFESGYGSGNPGINIWAKGFQSLSSRLSTKHQVRLLDDEHSNSLLLGADTATFKYNQDTNADNSNEGVIIDDVNTVKQYNLPDELITRDGKAPTDLMSFIARIISQNKYQARLIENLQIRLRKVEIKNE